MSKVLKTNQLTKSRGYVISKDDRPESYASEDVFTLWV
jgi:hypothetical protein